MPSRIQVQGREPAEIAAAEKAAAEKKKEEAKNKKPAPAVKEKKWFDIRLECMVPCIVQYRVFADDEQDALQQMDKKTPSSVKPNILRKKNVKATIYDAGSSLIRYIKNFRA
jgi:hypothetical protein